MSQSYEKLILEGPKELKLGLVGPLGIKENKSKILLHGLKNLGILLCQSMIPNAR